MTPEREPIGTEFWGPRQFDVDSTNSYALRFMYRVVGYSKCVLSKNPNAPTRLLADIKPIAAQHADITGYNRKTGEYIWGEWYDT